ncbi:ATP-binding cassette domain-containing protein [Gordonia humi]
MNALDITGLMVTGPGGHRILDDVDLRITAGGVTAVTGPSGSGKTTLALAAVGHVRPGLAISAGRIRTAGSDVVVDGTRSSESAVRRLRRDHVTYVGQDPGTALTPSMRVGELISELARDDHDPRTLLQTVGLPTDEEFLSRRPRHLSGGQRRRVALVRALAAGGGLVMLDEPTAGLDAATARDVADLISRLVAATGKTAIVITHDLPIAYRISDRIVEMADGRIVADGPPPAAPVPRGSTTAIRGEHVSVGDARLTVDGLRLTYPGRRDPICSAASLRIAAGEAVGLSGDSGTGKSTLARALVGLHPPDAGRIVLDGTELADRVRRRTRAQARAVCLIPQDPASTLNPAVSVGTSIARFLPRTSAGRRRDRVRDLLADVGLDPDLARRRPGRLSGGQRQRVAIARALAADPRLLICDEVTASLDPASTDRIIELLTRLRIDHGVSSLIVAHDAHVLDALCSRTVQMSDL